MMVYLGILSLAKARGLLPVQSASALTGTTDCLPVSKQLRDSVPVDQLAQRPMAPMAPFSQPGVSGVSGPPHGLAGGGMPNDPRISQYSVGNDLFRIESSRLPELKQELGLAAKDLPSLTVEEKVSCPELN